MAFTTITPFPSQLTPMANVGPLTYADGTTYLRELAYIKDWLNGVLVPGFNAAIDNAIEEYQTGVTNAEQTVTAAQAAWLATWEAWQANITLELAALNDAALGDLIVDELSNTYAALATLIDTLTVAPDELDASVTTIVNDGASALRVALNTLYVNEADNTAALALKLDASEKGATNGVASLVAGKVPVAQLPATTPTYTGTYAARPAAATYQAGTLYYATDTLELYRTTGSAWVVFGAAGNELAFTRIDPSVPMFETTSTAYVDVPGLSINVTAGERPFTVKFQCAGAADAPSPVKYALYVGGVLRHEFDFRVSGIDEWETFTGEYAMRGLTPGTSYVAKIMVKAWTGTTCRTSGAPFIQAVGL